MREVSGFIPSRGAHKNLNCEHRESSDYVSFRKAIKREGFRSLKHMVQSNEQHNNVPYKQFTL